MKDAYRNLCNAEPSIPLFSQAWWLDAVADDAWDVALVHKGEEVVASMPYVMKQKYGMHMILQPSLTQTLGPWIRQTNAKYAKRLSREKELMEALINQLPKYDYFVQNWDHKQTNWLPFYWKGFSQTTRYTYRIENLKQLDSIWLGLRDNTRGKIKKAGNRENITVRDDLPFSDFYTLNTMVFKRQGGEIPYTEKFVTALDQAAIQKGCRKLFIAEDGQGQQHAGLYLVWDESSAYCLMIGGNPALRNSGATSLCVWEAIKFASTVTQSFDFEGSMLEPIEQFFRSFGAIQTPYHRISHTPSKILTAAIVLKGLLR